MPILWKVTDYCANGLSEKYNEKLFIHTNVDMHLVSGVLSSRSHLSGPVGFLVCLFETAPHEVPKLPKLVNYI